MNRMLMNRYRPGWLTLIAFACFTPTIVGQATTGSLEISARVRIDGKQHNLERKRFYLLRGSLVENKSLLDRIRNTQFVSRDCYYSRVQASPQFICWLQSEKCDSPFCRELEASDVDRVPEFKIAYQRGLTLFGNKPDIALGWLTTNLSPALTGGYHREQNSLMGKLLAGIRPVQSSMTVISDQDLAKAFFLDIPVSLIGDKTSETFTVSNILPIELAGKGFVWSCEAEVSPDEAAEVRLQVPVDNKPVKNCEVVIKDLAVCKSGGCAEG
jgi:hypothetical protein